MKKAKLMLGDNIESLKKLPDNSIDSVVTDGPYGLTFMNKKWDYDVPSVEFWKEVYRVLKPGGHALSFGGTRTYHRMVVNIEDAGFEIRDQIMWLYGSGFPKSHNIGIAIDKLEGNENDWEGWGSALKPANEPICLARKPLSEKSIAENVLKWGTGGINVNGCKIGTDENGRFPANIILDEIAGGMLDEQSGISKSSKSNKIYENDTSGRYVANCASGIRNPESTYGDTGGASRFFYQAKVSKAERNMGLDEFDDKVIEGRDVGQDERSVAYKKRPTPTKNTHPTLKPVSLMSYLCRLITPPNGIVLDPFMGSGSTGISALLEGFRFCGMEMDPDYFKIAEARINSYEDYKKFIKK